VSEIDLDSIVEVVPRLHAFYDANATLLRAVRRAPALNRLLEDQRQRRAERITGAVAARHPRWTKAECASSAAAIQLVMSPATWQWLQVSETSASRTSEIVMDMLRALIARMEQEGPIGGQEEEK
jgi:hypothetical protein